MLTVPTHTGTLTELPDRPWPCASGAGAWPDARSEPLHRRPPPGRRIRPGFPFVRHVHLRDTGRGQDQFQVRVGQGEVEYGKIVATCARYRLRSFADRGHPRYSRGAVRDGRRGAQAQVPVGKLDLDAEPSLGLFHARSAVIFVPSLVANAVGRSLPASFWQSVTLPPSIW